MFDTGFSLEARPGMISVLGGKSNPSSFPFAALTLELKPIDGGKTETLRLEGEELANALQYGATAGMPQLVEVRALTPRFRAEHLTEPIHSG